MTLIISGRSCCDIMFGYEYLSCVKLCFYSASVRLPLWRGAQGGEKQLSGAAVGDPAVRRTKPRHRLFAGSQPGWTIRGLDRSEWHTNVWYTLQGQYKVEMNHYSKNPPFLFVCLWAQMFKKYNESRQPLVNTGCVSYGIQVSGLHAGQIYRFRVSAVSAAGVGCASLPSESVVAQTQPGELSQLLRPNIKV